MADPVSAVVSYLRSNGPVYSKVGNRVFGGEIPKGEIVSMPRVCVTVRPAGGATMGTGTMLSGDTRLDVECYGDTPLTAWQLYQAVKPALKYLVRGTHAGTLLHWAKESGGGAQGRDPDTDWPVVLSSWQIFAEESAT